MTDATLPKTASRLNTADRVKAGLKRRYAAEKRFKVYGLVAILVALSFLLILLTSIVGNGYTAFWQTYVALDIHFSKADIDPKGSGDPQSSAGQLRRDGQGCAAYPFPEVTSRRDRRMLNALISSNASFDPRHGARRSVADRHDAESVVPASTDIDIFVKGLSPATSPGQRRVKDIEIGWIKSLQRDGPSTAFNTRFFTDGDSRTRSSPASGARWSVLLYADRHPDPGFPAWRHGGGLPGRVRAEEPLDRPCRGEHQQPGGRALHRVRPAGAGGVPQLLRTAPLGPVVGGMVLALMTLPTIIIRPRRA